MERKCSCDSCRWSVQMEEYATPVYECHRFPPLWSKTDETWLFPEVAMIDGCFCGEYVEDELDDSEEIAERREGEGCASCRFASVRSEDGKEIFSCHRRPPVLVNDKDGESRFAFPELNEDEKGLFCGEQDIPLDV